MAPIPREDFPTQDVEENQDVLLVAVPPSELLGLQAPVFIDVTRTVRKKDPVVGQFVEGLVLTNIGVKVSDRLKLDRLDVTVAIRAKEENTPEATLERIVLTEIQAVASADDGPTLTNELRSTLARESAIKVIEVDAEVGRFVVTRLLVLRKMPE